MQTNRQLLAHLFERGQIDLARGAIFDTAPEPRPAGPDCDRVEGMMLGLAVGDAEEVIVRAANDTVDNDTIAAIVGAGVGALHGKKGLPARWVLNLLGRTGADDDRRFGGMNACLCQIEA